MLTQIYNGIILTPGGWLKNGSLIIQQGKILEVTACDLPIVGAKRVDANGMYIVPGFIDLHVHGGGGRDFQEGTHTAFMAIARAHARFGTTSMFATLSSSTWPMMLRAIDTCDQMVKDPACPILGLHLEGPYINPGKAGAQMTELLKI
ncbi:MAG: amidohydrolase family protein, partial [Bacteroidaceae bacterium]|nr:amidohydrolase family protein [Bacteroidaceae bacterium]